MLEIKMLLFITGFLLAGRSVLLTGSAPTTPSTSKWNFTENNGNTSHPPSPEFGVLASLAPTQNGKTAGENTKRNQALEIQASFLDSSTLEDMSSKSQIQFSGVNAPAASLFSVGADDYSTTAAQTSGPPNVTAGLPTNDTASHAAVSWPWHSYIFGASFAVMALLSTVSLFHFFCISFSERVYFAVSNALLLGFCVSRCCYIFETDLGSDDDVEAAATALLYQASTVALTAAIMLLASGLCLFCQVSWWKFQPLRPTVVNLFVFPYCALLTATIFLAVILEWLGHQRALQCLVVVQKLMSIAWGSTFVIFSWLLYDRLYKASIMKQGQILRATLTQLHIEGAQLPKTLPKSKLCLSVRALCVTTILFFILNFLTAYGLFFVDRNGLAVHFHQADPTSWGLFQNALRIFEVGTCSCLAAAHFWSQSGHQCRPLLKRTNSLFEMTTDLWRSSAERLRRLSEGHFRRRCFGSDHRPLERPPAAPFEIYYPSSSGITGTHFTFEKWERSCCSPAAATCRPPEGVGIGVHPILKTFQRLSQVSPQRFQLNPVRLSAPSSSWSLSSAVVAGLKSLTPTRRSSSSSGSSTSGTPFAAAAAAITLQSARMKRNQDPVDAFTVPPVDFPSRPPEGINPRTHHAHCKNSYQRSRYGNKPIKGSLAQSQATEMVRKGQLSIRSTHEKLLAHRKVKLQRDGRNAEEGKRKKALMVSRATQVYIPSPDRRAFVQNYQRSDPPEGVHYHHLSSPYDFHRGTAEDRYGAKYYHQVAMPNSVPALIEPEHFKRPWHGANSSTSCSSESAANSFDVRFYVYSASSEGASPSNSSPSHDFHDHYYAGVCHAIQATSGDSGGGKRQPPEALPSQHHQNSERHTEDRTVIHEPPDGALGTPTTVGSGEHHPSLNLSLPLQESCPTATSDSKNLQDITPDSAVYLELNLPQTEPPLEGYSMAEAPYQRLQVKKCVSLLDLSRLEGRNHHQVSALLQPAVSMTVLPPSGSKMADLTLELSCGREGPLYAMSHLSNSDSLYDSRGSAEFLRTVHIDSGPFC